jgi:uncharacterized membrane protein YiaA
MRKLMYFVCLVFLFNLGLKQLLVGVYFVKILRSENIFKLINLKMCIFILILDVI